MAYERQYHTNGDVLEARQLNHMETGIKENSDSVSKLSEEKANRIVETASGETIVVTDSDEKKPLGLAIDGKSEQTQYSGKNLWCFEPSYVCDKFAVLIDNQPIYLTEGVYTLSWVYKESSEQVLLRFTGVTGKTYEFRTQKLQGYTFTFDEDIVECRLVANGDANFDISNIQLEHGEVATTYEPYCGGIPSPSPEYKQEIRNIGVYDEASGKYATEVKGNRKNLLDISKITSSVKVSVEVENETISATGKDSWAISNYVVLPVIAGKQYIVSVEKITGGNNPAISIRRNSDGKGIKDLGTTGETTLKIPDGETHVRVMFIVNGSSAALSEATTATFVKPMIRLAEITDSTYEPYKETTATVYLDEPLRGIPVSSGGNYTDSNGQQWICDEVDFARSKLVQRVAEHKIKSVSTKREISTLADVYFLPNKYGDAIGAETNGTVGNICSSHFLPYTVNSLVSNDKSGIGIRDDSQLLIAFGIEQGISTVELADEWLVNNDVCVIYPLKEAIETDLSEDVINAYKNLSMFYPTTVISNDCNANMEVEYIADTKAYIDKKFAELATAMV